MQELYLLADDISLHVPDMETFIENLNTAGYLLKKGPRLYQVRTTQRESRSEEWVLQVEAVFMLLLP